MCVVFIVHARQWKSNHLIRRHLCRSALLRVLSEGGDARAAVDVLGITEAGVEADLALLAKGGMLAIGLTQVCNDTLVATCI